MKPKSINNMCVRSIAAARRPILVAVALACAISTVHAAGTDTWKSNGTANWSVAGNWSAGSGGTAPPAAGDTIAFGATTGVTTLNNDLADALSFGGITFNSGAAAYTFGGNSITLAGNISQNAASAQIINLPIAMTAVRTVNFGAGAGNVTLGGTLSGTSGGITASLAGASTATLTLSGKNNAQTGVNTVNGQGVTLVLDYSSNGNAKLGTGNLTLSGGTLSLSGGSFADAVGATTTLTAGTINTINTINSSTATLNLKAITRNTASGLNFGAASIASTTTANTSGILGPGWATINNTDWAVGGGTITTYASYTGVTRLSSGTKSIANNSANNVQITDGTGSAADITLAAATTAINSLNQSATGASEIDPAGQTLQVRGILMGISAGALTIGNGVNNGSLAAGASGGELILNNQSANTLTINSVIANNTSASSLASLAGTNALTAASTYSGTTYVSGGKLQLTGSGTLPNAAVNVYNGALDLNSTTLNPTAFVLGAVGTVNPIVSIGASGVLNLASDITFGFNSASASGTISGGTLNLNGNRTFSPSSALLTVSANIANGSVSGSSLTVGTSFVTLAGSNSFTGPLIFTGNGGGTLTLSNNYVLNGSSGVSITSAAGNGAPLYLAGGTTISGLTLTNSSGANIAFGVSGSGTATWNGNVTNVSAAWGNPFRVTPNSSSGTFIIGTSAAQTFGCPSGMKIDWNNNGAGTTIVNSTIVGGPFNSGNFAIKNGTLQLNCTNNSFTAPTIDITGTAILVVSNLANQGVNCSIGSGAASGTQIINLGGGSQNMLRYVGTGDTCDRAIFAQGTAGGYGACLDMSGTGTLTLTGAITNGANTMFLQGSTAGIGQITGGIVNGTSNNRTLNKTGTGTWILGGTSTYAGATTISGGTLVGLVGGSVASAVTVNNTAGCTLGVSITDNTKGWTNNGVTVAGTSATLDFNFGSFAPSTTLAPMQVNGTVTFTGLPKITMEATNVTAGVAYPLMTWTGTDPSVPTSFTMRHYTGVFSISSKTLFVTLTYVTDSDTWTAGNGTWDINTTANWKDAIGPTYYMELATPGDSVTFDDTPGTSGNYTVTLGTTVNPTSVTVNNPTSAYTISGSGAIAGTASLAKSGAGILTLTGTNTYSGVTTVSAGELVGATGGSSSNSIVTVSAGATNGVSILGANGQWFCAGLTNSTSTGYMDINLGSVGLSTTAAPLQVNGPLVVSSNLKIIVRGAAVILNGQYPLVKYTGTLSGTPPTTALSLPTGVVASISNNTANSSIDLVVTGATPVYWAVGSGNWDISTSQNWKNTTVTGATNAYYVDGEAVTLDDSTGGNSPFLVTNAVTVSPASVTVNSTNSYTISGSAIAGSGSLTKSGSGTLNLNTANGYTGGTTISAGSVYVGNNNALGIGSVVLSGSANPSGTIYLNDGITVTNALISNCSGATSTLDKNTGSGNSIWTGNIVVQNSQSLYIKNDSAGTLTIGNDATTYITNVPTSGSLLYFRSAGSVVVNSKLTGAAYANGANVGYMRVFAGNNILTINSTNNDFNGDVNIWQATYVKVKSLAPQGTVSSLGTNGVIRLGNGTSAGNLTYIGAGAAQTDRPLDLGGLTGGATLDQSGTNGLLLFDGTFTSSGVGSKTLTLQGSTVGTGEIDSIIVDDTTGTNHNALTKSGTGTWTLGGANTYSGATTISGGTLLVNGAIGTNSVTVQTNAKLGGAGTIGGNVTFNSGASATNNQGSPLTISGSLTLNNNTNNTMYLSTASALGAGDYTLLNYSAAGSSGSFNTTPVVSGVGLAANTTGTIVTGGGTVKLHVVLNTQPTTLALSSSVNPSIYGQTVTFTAAVLTNSVTAGNATSNIVFKVDGTPVATNGAASGQATFVTSLLIVPSHTITAEYTGDANYLPSTNSLSQIVNQAPLGITANNTNKVYNGVAFSGGNGVTYFGFVNSETSTTLGGSLSYGGTSQGATNVGSYNIIPSGLTSANYSISYTNGTLTINQANTFVGASSTENPSGYKDAISYIATLPTNATGNVVFSSTNGPISTNSVSSGSATSLSVTNLPRGTNVITVAYLGDGNYLGSTTNLNQIVTNHPPVANVMAVTRTAGLALIIKLSDIATNWSDADGDTIELTSVTMQSTNGVNLFPLNWSTNLDGSIVTTNGYAYIGYTNSPNVNDQISYGISDGFGGTNIGYVNIVIQGSVTGTNSITAYNFTSPGSNTVTAYGIPYFSYILERSTNLSSPVWVDVQTNQAAPNGVINMVDLFMDLGGIKPSPAFYQLKWQP